MKITRRVFLATGTAMAAVAAGQLGRKTPAVAQSGVVNVYSARHYDTDDQLYEGFTQRTGIRVNLVEANADQLIERITSEGANSPADVLITVDAGRLWRAREAGVLQPVNSATLNAAVPSSLRDPEGYWFGLTKRARVIYYDRNKVNPAQLSTYEDLADPKWRGKLLIRSSGNIYNQSLTGAILAAHGPERTLEWARGIAANLARSPEGGDTDQIKAVAAGVGEIAVANTYYYVRLMRSDNAADREVTEKVGVFFPNQRDRGTHVNISGAGVVRTAPNRQGAIQFIEYLASPEAQEMFADGNNEYPVLAGMNANSMVKSLGEFRSDSLNAAIFGRNNPEALRIMDQAGWR
ncbi:MAG: Fe(3+) ABC transporter substrate-binding protein [Desertifilum sp.]|nr:Fe(3+) ABC transporter substrate-binding protein [Desertifilum sp.]